MSGSFGNRRSAECRSHEGIIMINRRTLIAGVVGSPLLIRGIPACAQEAPGIPGAANASAQVDGPLDESLTQLEYPPLALLDTAKPFGNKPPPPSELARAKDVVNATPNGPTPVAIAQSFVDRFFASNPRVISQWPKPDAWNPLIVEFFKATTLKANNDMVAWCAAFANWCLDRAGKKSSRSAASQSFLNDAFERTATPKVGDLAIFTCYRPGTTSSLGLGHVGFVASLPDTEFVEILGGNQATDGHASIISRKKYAIGNRSVYRTLNGKKVPCTMRLNTYVKVV